MHNCSILHIVITTHLQRLGSEAWDIDTGNSSTRAGLWSRSHLDHIWTTPVIHLRELGFGLGVTWTRVTGPIGASKPSSFTLNRSPTPAAATGGLVVDTDLDGVEAHLITTTDRVASDAHPEVGV